jgi:tyrosyl-tRNA synthetase
MGAVWSTTSTGRPTECHHVSARDRQALLGECHDQPDSVRSRLEREGEGISYTEFSYMLLQAMDYLHLAQVYDCSLQIGGSDQWGNIVSGMDLVRRKAHRESFALTLPLVTKATARSSASPRVGGLAGQ